MTNSDKPIYLSLKDLELTNTENLGWFLITLYDNKIKLSYQNNPYKMAEVSLKTINIESIKFNETDGKNYRYLGRIITWPTKEEGDKNICKHYYCGQYRCNFNLSYLKGGYDECRDTEECDEGDTLWSRLGDNDADLCIKECNKGNYRCNIKECQERCLECKISDEDTLTEYKKKEVCPWLDNIKIDTKEPQPPFIRGFPSIIDNNEPNNGSIVIEWKKPYNNMSKITHYLLEIQETLSKYQSHKVITIEDNNCEICEYVIKNLKNQTNYDIELSAVNNQGISYKSNKINIKTNGSNNNFLNNIYKDISGENEAFMEYKCVNEFNNSDHILDQVMDEDINISDYINSM